VMNPWLDFEMLAWIDFEERQNAGDQVIRSRVAAFRRTDRCGREAFTAFCLGRKGALPQIDARSALRPLSVGAIRSNP